MYSTVGSDILLFINTCLSTGCVLTTLKHGVVQPLIKKKKSVPLRFLQANLQIAISIQDSRESGFYSAPVFLSGKQHLREVSV